MKRVVAALIVREGKILVCQRTRHQTMPLKWEFPGGKIEEGEQPRDALVRELEEELGINAEISEEVERMQHVYPNGTAVELRFFVVQAYEGKMENKIFKDLQWAGRSQLKSFDFLEADLKLVKDLSEGKLLGNLIQENLGIRYKPGDFVVLIQVPLGLLDGLPSEDQAAIVQIVGKPIRVVEYCEDERVELEFTDEHGIIHFIHVDTRFIRPASS